MESRRKVAAVMTCMDYRLHEPSAEQYRQLCDLLDFDRCYIETEAGPDGAVLNDEDRCCGAISNLIIIKEAKQPDVFAIVAHYDCAGHAVSDTQHDTDVVLAAQKLSVELFGEEGKVVPVIAHPNESNSPSWLIKKIPLKEKANAIAA